MQSRTQLHPLTLIALGLSDSYVRHVGVEVLLHFGAKRVDDEEIEMQVGSAACLIKRVQREWSEMDGIEEILSDGRRLRQLLRQAERSVLERDAADHAAARGESVAADEKAA